MVDAPDKGKPGIKYTMVSLSAALTYFRVTQQKTQKLIITLETVQIFVHFVRYQWKIIGLPLVA